MQNLEAPVSRDILLAPLDSCPHGRHVPAEGRLERVAPSKTDVRGVSHVPDGDHAYLRSRQSLDLHQNESEALRSGEGRESIIVHVRSGGQGNIGGRICNWKILHLSSESLITSSAILYWLQALTNGSTRWQVSLSLSLIPSNALTTEHLSLLTHSLPTHNLLHSTPLIQQPGAIVAPCVTSLGP